MPDLFHDVRLAARLLLRHRAYSAIVVLTLALGVGANSAIFTVINVVMLRPLPFQDSGRLVLLSLDTADPTAGVYRGTYEALSADPHSFDRLAVFYRAGFSQVTLTGAGEPEPAQGGFVSTDFFQLLGVLPSVGRTLTADDEAHHNRVVVLSAKLWRERFNSARDVIGRTIRVDGISSEIVGVMPATFQFPTSATQFWAPISTNRLWNDPAVDIKDSNRSRGFYARWTILGHLRPGATLASVGSEVNLIERRLARSNPIVDPNAALHAVSLKAEIGRAHV